MATCGEDGRRPAMCGQEYESEKLGRQNGLTIKCDRRHISHFAILTRCIRPEGCFTNLQVCPTAPPAAVAGGFFWGRGDRGGGRRLFGRRVCGGGLVRDRRTPAC